MSNEEERQTEMIAWYGKGDEDRIDPWLCPVCGKQIYISGTTTNGRLIGSCRDAFTLDFFLQETRDFLINTKGHLLVDAERANDWGESLQEDWAHLSRAFVELGLDPLQPIEEALKWTPTTKP